MKLYAGIDLHSTNSYVVILDDKGALTYKKRLPNDIETILYELRLHDGIESIVVESTYNWYWLVDGLQDAGYLVRLANTTAIQQYNGLKHTNDKTDARWLAELDRLNILPEGHIYPKEGRGVRDLLRKRLQLVNQRTSNLLSIQTIIVRNTSKRVTANKIKQFTAEELKKHLSDEAVFLAANSNLTVMNCIKEQINIIEKKILPYARESAAYQNLQTVSGIGKILSFTILLETGEINRFKKPGNYASYCRCVDSERKSNEKKKGENNRKNGNQYLCWAYIEAANFAIRYNNVIKGYYQRKARKTNNVVAIKTVAHKLARACFYIIRDGVKFDEKLAFMQ
jgi:transposase